MGVGECCLWGEEREHQLHPEELQKDPQRRGPWGWVSFHVEAFPGGDGGCRQCPHMGGLAWWNYVCFWGVLRSAVEGRGCEVYLCRRGAIGKTNKHKHNEGRLQASSVIPGVSPNAKRFTCKNISSSLKKKSLCQLHFFKWSSWPY